MRVGHTAWDLEPTDAKRHRMCMCPAGMDHAIDIDIVTAPFVLDLGLEDPDDD